MIFTPNTIKSIVRALTPWLLTTLGALAAHFGFHVSNAASLQGLVLAGGVLTVVLHSLESRFPWVGTLLGWVGAPFYVPGKSSQQATIIATLESEVAALSKSLSAAQAPQSTVSWALTAPATVTPLTVTLPGSSPSTVPVTP